MALRAARAQPDDAEVEVVRALRDHDRALDVAATEMARSWAGGVAGLIGVSSVLGVVGVPTASERLAAVPRIAVGVLLAIALFAAFAALRDVLTAAHGAPVFRPAPTTPTALRAMRTARPRTTILLVARSHRWATVAVASLALAVALVWITAEEQTTPTAPVVVVVADGQRLCGSLRPARPGDLALEVAGEVVDLDVASISAVEPAAGC